MTATADRLRTTQLRRLSETIRARQDHLRELELKRTEAIRQAIGQGWTHARIAEATGLTRGRINQLAHRRIVT